MFPPGQEGRDAIIRMRTYAAEAGRDPESVGIEGRVGVGPDTGPEDWITEMKSWEELGASHLAVSARLNSPGSPDDYINAIRRYKEELP
jgi:hypothetical protein